MIGSASDEIPVLTLITRHERVDAELRREIVLVLGVEVRDRLVDDTCRVEFFHEPRTRRID